MRRYLLNIRKCFKCNDIDLHETPIAPEVNCKSCGSQDTRLLSNDKIVNSDTSNVESVLIQVLNLLSDEARLNVINKFCKFCGKNKLPCHCWNDE